MTTRLAPLKHIAGINERALGAATDPDYSFRYVDIGTVGRGELVAEPQEVRFEDAPSRARRLVSAGDTIVSTVRTYLRAVWPVSDAADELVVSTGFAVLTPRAVDPRYFSWWVRADPFIEEVVARSVGVSYPAINALELGELKVRLPSSPEQRAIADFLDTETARIDALITKKRRMIGLLSERFRSLVSETVSAGRLMEVRRVIGMRTSGPRGWAERVGTEGAPFIRSQNLRREDIDLNLTHVARVQPPENPEARRSRTSTGDVLIGITGANTGWVGIVGGEATNGYVSQHVAVLRPTGLIPGWLAYSLFAHQAQDQLLGGQYGGTKTQLGLDDLAELQINVPSRLEQEEGLARLSGARRVAHLAGQVLSRQLALLQEHRQALVTAAVTGELEVPGVAA